MNTGNSPNWQTKQDNGCTSDSLDCCIALGICDSDQYGCCDSLQHKLRQLPDDQLYGDGLDDWTCTCGDTFTAGELDQAFIHGLEVGQQQSEIQI